MDDYAITQQEHRLLIVRPGDILVVGHAANLTSEAADRIKRSLDLGGIIGLPDVVDIATVRQVADDR